MSRTIDESKIERIKEATMEMIVSKGYEGASISGIAGRAGVAEGYLYRFYKSKSELVNDLLFIHLNSLMDNLENLLNKHYSVRDIFEQMIRTLFGLANTFPERIKFLYVLMNDYNFKIQENQRERIFNLCKRVKETGLFSKEIRVEIDEEEIFLFGVTYPIQFINMRLKNFFNRSELGEKEIIRVLKICINSLKRDNYES
ncbi:MAG: TetR/AcrR family transcriptional regulator [Bacteroidota bacterium]|nr:TetR/AcrR family transcriptional regulator [Bacteroidota bacterium]MDP4226979.1 TetR/AcrR family transcriptional regulator [Bacteroidota bacterium]MDP4275237.1 TetR/AcrR family transcriptional regulator [Bacteroidota bacterium]